MRRQRRCKTLAVLGLTFKPETDDMRDAPSLPIVHRLVEEGAVIRAFDPEGMEQALPMLPEQVVFCRDANDALEGVDAMVIVTEWNEFRAIRPLGWLRCCAKRSWSICGTCSARWRCSRPGCTTSRLAALEACSRRTRLRPKSNSSAGCWRAPGDQVAGVSLAGLRPRSFGTVAVSRARRSTSTLNFVYRLYDLLAAGSKPAPSDSGGLFRLPPISPLL